jgi:DNA mismatch repair protein MutS
MAKDTKLTPMMVQYRKLKAEVSVETLLLFRMGDFYEMFFEDAVKGSENLDIALTKRAGVAMAGIPYHSLQNYLPRLLEAGIKVAVAEQMEDPKQATGIVKREITQIITPGTILEGDVLPSGKSNFLVSIAISKKDRFGIASLDISTGDFRLTEVDTVELLETELHRLQPAECLIPESLHDQWGNDEFPEVPGNMTWTPGEDWTFDTEVATDLLQRHFGVVSLDGYGCKDYQTAVRAAGAIMHYARSNLRRDADHITTLTTYSSREYMVIDRISQRNLELVEPLFSDAKNATLLSILNQTITPMGSRMIREWILRPLMESAIGRYRNFR